jgi:hypothetical protein
MNLNRASLNCEFFNVIRQRPLAKGEILHLFRLVLRISLLHNSVQSDIQHSYHVLASLAPFSHLVVSSLSEKNVIIPNDISVHVKRMSKMPRRIRRRNPNCSKKGTVTDPIEADHVDRKVPAKHNEEVQ